MQTTPSLLSSFPSPTGFAGAADWKLCKGDALSLLERLEAGRFELVVADPPYFLSNGGFSCKGGKRVPVDKGSWDASRGMEADLAFTHSWLHHCRRLLSAEGSLWVSGTQHNIFMVGFVLQQLGYRLLNTVTWYKPNASPNLSCRYFTHSTELLLWAAPPSHTKGKQRHVFNYPLMKQLNGNKQMRDVWALPKTGEEELSTEGEGKLWSFTRPGKEEKRFGAHPTQKPLALMKRIVEASSQPGAWVLDPFCGSGTTGVAALETGRRFVGIDCDEASLALARRRLGAARRPVGYSQPAGQRRLQEAVL
jgi:site-specific DNA-methyltransferase (adenine-specific)